MALIERDATRDGVNRGGDVVSQPTLALRSIQGIARLAISWLTIS